VKFPSVGSVFRNIRSHARRLSWWEGEGDVFRDCTRLLQASGESVAYMLAGSVWDRWSAMGKSDREKFYAFLAESYNPDPAVVLGEIQRWVDDGSVESMMSFVKSSKSPRRELLRRLNASEGGTASIVKMRQEVLELLPQSPSLLPLESDLCDLLSSWFNPGFLTLSKLGWNSPASLLEKIIRLEAVHSIEGWSDLRRRLDSDRRLFAFFHPSLPEEPLIFVEVALTRRMPSAIGEVLDASLKPLPLSDFRTAVFYSISNCQPGLKGIRLGNFLIKRVVSSLAKELPLVKKYCTLSPVPTLCSFARKRSFSRLPAGVPSSLLKKLENLDFTRGVEDPLLANFCAAYLLQSSPSWGDPVARFHLDNGARLERINLSADLSEKASRQSSGVMVNYAYDPPKIESNSMKFHEEAIVPASKDVISLLVDNAQSRKGLV
jgi:malonyl-CoA decarboxylase